MKRAALVLASAALAFFLDASPALASFHLMKIEQAIGGVGGDTTQQAVQLRMRAPGQNLVGGTSRIRAWDAAGANPVTLVAFPTNVANGGTGDRILVATAAFAAAQSSISPDFTMAAIPASYLAGGRLTFETSTGGVLYSLAWGTYTGSNTGTLDNDGDGNFGPPFGAALPSSLAQALRFATADPAGSALSTSNQVDYALTSGAATFTNNAGSSGTVVLPPVQADLSLTLTDAPDPVAPSQPVVYTIAVANAGPATATSVAVIDTFPAGTVFQSATGSGWSCSAAATSVTCTRATLTPGPAPDLTVVLVAPSSPGMITNTASVSSTTSDPNLTDNTDSETTTVGGAPGQADLAVTKSDGGLEGRYGFPLAYTVVVTNNGPSAVAGATLTDDFPAGLQGITWTCTPSAGSTCPASGSGGIAAALTLLSGGTATFTAVGTPAPGTASPLVNTATIAPPAGVTDPVPGNDSATTNTTLGQAQFFTATPCRVADTRNAAGPSGGPRLAANTARTFPVRGLCGLPADTRAVVLNVAVVLPTDIGNLRLFPSGRPAPLASALNFVAGAIRANNAIIGLGADGGLTVQCDMPPGSNGATDVLIDVAGYLR